MRRFQISSNVQQEDQQVQIFSYPKPTLNWSNCSNELKESWSDVFKFQENYCLEGGLRAIITLPTSYYVDKYTEYNTGRLAF